MKLLLRLLLPQPLLLLLLPLTAQVSGVPLNSPTYQLIDRLEIKYGGAAGPTPELKFFSREEVAAYAELLLRDSASNYDVRARDRADLRYLLNDNNEWTDSARQSRRPLLRYFYRTPANLFEVNARAFRMRVNPMFNFQVGPEVQGDPQWTFLNQRGLEIRADVDRKVFIYTSLLESQGRFPNYVNQWANQYNALPNAGWTKPYNSVLLDVNEGRDFAIANAYVGVKVSRHIGLQLGHGRHFIGNGYRSMLLSDFGAPTFFLKFDTKVWLFHYQNLFFELTPFGNLNTGNNERLPKKYVAAHYLNFRPSPNFSVGLFEATVLNRSRQFELQYLNPVILYRTVEGMIGSPDNVLIGLDTRWNFLRRFQLYGQLMVDEFVLRELRARSGWWANKFGIQAGAKYVNAFGVEHLDLQVEFNSARPYTYSHFDSLNSYSHYGQPLAHPLGANFREVVALARWQPTPRLAFTARYVQMRTGDDPTGVNYGSNLLLAYTTRPFDYGNRIGQGVAATTHLLGLDASWMLHHNVYFDLRLFLRQKNSAEAARSLTTQVVSAGFRANLWNTNLDF